MAKLIVTLGILISCIFSSFSVTAVDASGREAMQKMAEIMLRLKHFPSPQGKQELQSLADSKTTTERERVIAQAIMNLQHRAIDEDKAKLKQIMDSTDASADERDLAGIVYNLDHRPTKADKERLKLILAN